MRRAETWSAFLPGIRTKRRCRHGARALQSRSGAACVVRRYGRPRIRRGSDGAGCAGDGIRLYPAAVGAKRSPRRRPPELPGPSARATVEQGRASGAHDGRPRGRSEVIAVTMPPFHSAGSLPDHVHAIRKFSHAQQNKPQTPLSAPLLPRPAAPRERQ